MTPQFLPVIRALVAIEQAAVAEDAKAGRQAIRDCWDAAKDLFSDHAKSRGHFKKRLEGIRDDLKAGRYSQVNAASQQLREQLDQPLQAIASELTQFDYYIGHLCKETYSGAVSRGLSAMFGVKWNAEDAFLWAMKFILTYPLSDGLEEDDAPGPLLKEKAAQNPDSASQVDLAGKALDRQVDRGGWAELERIALTESRSRIEILVARLVQTSERLYSRPEGPIPRAYFAHVASFMFAAGLHLIDRYPQFAQELKPEKEGEEENE